MPYVDYEALASLREKVQTAPSGFRYGFLQNIFHENAYRELVQHFPATSGFKLVDKQSGGGRKRFYVGPKYFSGRHYGCVCDLSSIAFPWRSALKELASPRFIASFKEATSINFNSLCDFGLMYGNESCMQEAHIDGSALADDPNEVRSTIACILYFNENPDTIGGTCVYDIDRKTILAQAPNLRNGIFFFEQHPQAWHGFPVMPANTQRHILSLSYSLESQPIALKTSLTHRLACRRFLRHQLNRLK